MSDFKVKAEDVHTGSGELALTRVYVQYQRAVEQGTGILMVNRQDLATVVAMAALWLEGKRA